MIREKQKLMYFGVETPKTNPSTTVFYQTQKGLQNKSMNGTYKNYRSQYIALANSASKCFFRNFNKYEKQPSDRVQLKLNVVDIK